MVEVATAAVPVPSKISFVISFIGALPLGAEISGFLPFSPVTMGKDVGACDVEAADGDEEDLVTVVPPQALRMSAAIDRDIASDGVGEMRPR